MEVGYCAVCKKQWSGYPIPSKKSVLGENVRKYVCVLSIVNRLPHNQIQNHLKDVFSLNISIGEIGNILETEANNLRPDYQALKESVLIQNGTHYDETGWKVQREEQGKFAWWRQERKTMIPSLILGKAGVREISKTSAFRRLEYRTITEHTRIHLRNINFAGLIAEKVKRFGGER